MTGGKCNFVCLVMPKLLLVNGVSINDSKQVGAVGFLKVCLHVSLELIFNYKLLDGKYLSTNAHI